MLRLWSSPPAALNRASAGTRWQWQGPDYGLFLPAMAWLISSWAYRLAGWRGLWAYKFSRDWAELSVGEPYLRARTSSAWRDVFPSASHDDIAVWTRERYQTVSEEELEARWIANGDLSRFSFEGENLVQTLSQRGTQGLVLVQPHFNNPLVGCIGLAAMTGARVWVTMSAVTDHPQVHPLVSAHFRNKYATAQQWLNGGGFVNTENPGALRKLYRALQAGDVLVVMADIPPQPGQPGVCVQWMGKKRLLAEGAVRLAQQTGSRLAAMWVERSSQAAWRWKVSALKEACEGVQPAFDALAAAIEANPGRWWGAHLLLESPICTSDEDDGEMQRSGAGL